MRHCDALAEPSEAKMMRVKMMSKSSYIAHVTLKPGLSRLSIRSVTDNRVMAASTPKDRSTVVGGRSTPTVLGGCSPKSHIVPYMTHPYMATVEMYSSMGHVWGVGGGGGGGGGGKELGETREREMVPKVTSKLLHRKLAGVSGCQIHDRDFATPAMARCAVLGARPGARTAGPQRREDVDGLVAGRAVHWVEPAGVAKGERVVPAGALPVIRVPASVREKHPWQGLTAGIGHIIGSQAPISIQQAWALRRACHTAQGREMRQKCVRKGAK